MSRSVAEHGGVSWPATTSRSAARALPGNFFFGFFNAVSGQTYYDNIYISGYNMCFTALPVVIRAVVEQEVARRAVESGARVVFDEVVDADREAGFGCGVH